MGGGEMANILEELLNLYVEVKSADAEIEATAVGAECDIAIPAIDLPIRLKGGKHVRITSVTVERTK